MESGFIQAFRLTCHSVPRDTWPMSGIKHHRVSLLFFLTALAWQPASSDSAADVVNKLRYQEKPIAGHPGTMLKLVFFDEKDFSLRVVVNSDRESAKRLDALGGQSGAVAVCITEFTVKRALNLDGGPSTGLWCKKQDGTVSYTKSGWAVRNGIAILPRQNPLN